MQNFQGLGSEAGTFALGRIGDRILALPQARVRPTLVPSGGVIERLHARTAEIATFRSASEIGRALVIAGCDPSVSILADWLARRRSPAYVVALPCSSRQALDELRDSRAHVAGVHLRDSRNGEYNRRLIQHCVGQDRWCLVRFARWELGVATATGNPLRVRGLDDFGQAGLRLANRESGSGARAFLDEQLSELGLDGPKLRGYACEFGGHLEVAAAIASGLADVGITIRVAARAYGLGFIPLREERYDLALPVKAMDSMAVIELLEVLNSSRFAQELGQTCAYDTSEMGELIMPEQS